MTSQASRIRWNSLFAFLSHFIRLATNFLLFMGIARLYGPEAFGKFTTAHSLSTIFLLFADFGFDTLLTTEVARYRERAIALSRQYFSLKAIFGLSATVVMMLTPLVHSFSAETNLLIEIFALYVLFSSLNNFLYAVFKGFEQFQHETTISFGINILLLILLVVLGIYHAPLYVIALVLVGTRALGFVINLKVASQMLTVSIVSFDISEWKSVWPKVVVFGLYALFGNLYFLLDTVLLAFWRNDHDVGIYQSVFKIALLTLIIPDIAMNTLTPVLARLHQEKIVQWNSVSRLLNKTLLFFSLPVAIILFVYAEQVIPLLYGESGFESAVPILRIFSGIIFIRFAVEGYALMLTTSQRQSTRTKIVIGATIINILLNLFAIPHYGPLGAAMVSLITNIIVGAGYIIATRQLIPGLGLDYRSIVPCCLGIIFCLLMWNWRTVSLFYVYPFVLILCGSMFYFIGYTKDELKLIFTWKKSPQTI